MEREKKIKSISLLALFLLSFLIGLALFTTDPMLIGQDSMNCYTKALNIIAHNGLPIYRWYHTPLYPYLIAIVILLFDNNLVYLKIVQILIYIICTCLVYITIRVKKEQKYALMGSFFYMTSNISLYIATDIHQEGFVVLFILLMFYFYFKYEETNKSLFLHLGSISFGLAFFVKETVIVVIGIYVIYVFFWIKPSKKDFIISLGIISIFIGAFLIVDYLLGWFMISIYLTTGEGSDSFLSKNSLFDFQNFFNILSYEIIPTIVCIIAILLLLVQFIKDKKIGNEQVIAFSILVYLGVLLISRAGFIHYSYILFEISYISSIGIFKIEEWLKTKSQWIIKLNQKNKNYSIMGLLIPIIIIHLILFIPNISLIRDNKKEIGQVFEEISNYVGSEITYSQNHDAIGCYIENYYSDYSWYNSYKRNNFVEWSESDVFVLSSMKNITDYGIRYFIYNLGEIHQSDFFNEIVENGTLTFVKEYRYSGRNLWWTESSNGTLRLYEYIP